MSLPANIYYTCLYHAAVDIMIKASQRCESVSYAIREVVLPARELEKKGIKVLRLNIGDPNKYDFDTPRHIKDALYEAANAGHNGYAPSEGDFELRNAIIEREKKRNNVDYKLEDICITTGVTEGLQILLNASLDPRDELLLPGPTYPQYTIITHFNNARPLPYRCIEEEGWQPDVDNIREEISDRTKGIVLINPNNPTGALYSKKVIKEIIDIAGEYQVPIISDEIYEKLIYGDTKFVSFASLSEDAYNRTLTLNGFSKTFSMTGWRLGYTAGPLEAIKAMGRLQSHMTSNPVTFCQYAAIAALGEPSAAAIEQMRAEFERRGKYMSERLNGIKGVECSEPTGAFYCFPDVSAHYGRNINGAKIADSMDFAKALLEQANVALVPGLPFGCDRNVRLSFACSLEQITKGLDRLEEWLSQ